MFRHRFEVTMFMCAAVMLSFASCAPNPLPDIVDLRMKSISLLIGETRIAPSQTAISNAIGREYQVGIVRVIRRPISGDDIIGLDSARTLFLPEALNERFSDHPAETLSVERGAKTGPSESYHAVKPNSKLTFQVEYRGGQSALAMISSQSRSLRLQMSSEKKNWSCDDRAVRGVAFCQHFPDDDQNYFITIHNTNQSVAVFSLLTN